MTDQEVDVVESFGRSAEGRAVPLPGLYPGRDDDVALLALGFACGEAGALAVPYAPRTRKEDA